MVYLYYTAFIKAQGTPTCNRAMKATTWQALKWINTQLFTCFVSSFFIHLEWQSSVERHTSTVFSECEWMSSLHSLCTTATTGRAGVDRWVLSTQVSTTRVLFLPDRIQPCYLDSYCVSGSTSGEQWGNVKMPLNGVFVFPSKLHFKVVRKGNWLFGSEMGLQILIKSKVAQYIVIWWYLHVSE